MSDLFRIPVLSVLSVYMVLALGMFCRRGGWITAESTSVVVRLVVNLFMPCLIAAKVLGNNAFDNRANLFLPPLAGVGVVAVGMALAWLYARFLPSKLTGVDTHAKLGTFALCVGMLNYGYVPIPLIADLYPGDDRILSVLFVQNMGTEFALWTIGVFCLAGSFSRKSLAQMFNIPVMAILLCILIDLAGLSGAVPSLLMKTVNMIGDAAIPLSLLFVGAVVGECTMKPSSGSSSNESSSEVKEDKEETIHYIPLILSSCLLRLVVFPMLIIVAARFLPVSRELKIVLVIHAAMASAIFPIVLSRLYHGSVRTALTTILSNTLVAIVTTPLWIAYGLAFVGE